MEIISAFVYGTVGGIIVGVVIGVVGVFFYQLWGIPVLPTEPETISMSITPVLSEKKGELTLYISTDSPVELTHNNPHLPDPDSLDILNDTQPIQIKPINHAPNYLEVSEDGSKYRFVSHDEYVKKVTKEKQKQLNPHLAQIPDPDSLDSWGETQEIKKPLKG